jgi:hypothetical protein
MNFNDPNGPWLTGPILAFKEGIDDARGQDLVHLRRQPWHRPGIASNALWPRTLIATADVLAAEGVTDFDRYAYQPGAQPAADLFVDQV